MKNTRSAFKAIALASASLLSACGGGSDSQPSQPQSTLTFKGTAATGKPLASQSISITCQIGSASASTRNDGTFDASVQGTLPCLFTATLPDGQSLKSVAHKEGVVNVSPLTDLVVRIADNPLVSIDAATVAAANGLRRDFGILLSTSPVTTPFSANGVDHDYDIERFLSLGKTTYSLEPSTLPSASYAADLRLGAIPAALSSSSITQSRDWLANGAAAVLYGLDHILPDSYIVDTSQYLNQPFFVRVVGGGAANAWNYLLAMPAEEIPKATKIFVDSLSQLVVKEPGTGIYRFNQSAMGKVAWDALGVAAAGFGVLASPGKAVGAVCSTYNDASEGTGLGASYEDNKRYCAALASISDIFYSGPTFVSNATDAAGAVTRFKTTWVDQFNNSTRLMEIGRKRSTIDMFRRAAIYSISIKDTTSAFEVNNLNALYDQYGAALTSIGYSSAEISEALPRVACPAGFVLDSNQICTLSTVSMVLTEVPTSAWRLNLNITARQVSGSVGSFEFNALSCGGTLSYKGKDPDGSFRLTESHQYGSCWATCDILISSDLGTYTEECFGGSYGTGRRVYTGNFSSHTATAAQLDYLLTK